MSTEFIVGILSVTFALIVFVMFTIAPPARRISASRRVAEGEAPRSSIGRVTDQIDETTQRVLEKGPFRRLLDVDLEQSDITMPMSNLVIIVALAMFVLFLLGFVSNGPFGGVLLAALVPIGTKLILDRRAAKRRTKFGDQVDETVTLLAGALRAGHGLNRAVDLASRELEAPMGSELSRAIAQARLGRELGEAMGEAAERMDNKDFSWVAQAVSINREVGGNLADVLDGVGRTIRDRNQLRRQVQSLSAEGRMSAWVLIALPIGAFALLLMIQPNYLDTFFQNPLGWAALAIAAVLMTVGIVWIFRVVKVKF